MRYQLYYPTRRSKPCIIEVDEYGDRIRYVAEFYSEDDAKEFIDAINHVEEESRQQAQDAPQ